MDLRALVQKYGKPGPRYTSYPTAPQWSEQVGVAAYRALLKNCTDFNQPLALYVHLPFCESLCYYCGCNIQVTRDHGRVTSYIDALLKELREIAGHLPGRRSVSQISWGGGTPTFLSIGEIEHLFQGIQENFEVLPDAEVSIEIDPRVTSEEQLGCLRSLGFNRVSLGVQDFDTAVQRAVNRIQSQEMTGGMLERCRALGFTGINFDLIYGLPRQTVSSFEKTVQSVIEMGPDRIALYNYARLPSQIPHQKILEKFEMPTGQERIDIFALAYDQLTRSGYMPIGMDHFAKDSDELCHALASGSLYRNFMGYTVKKAIDMVGVGTSAIGEWEGAYFQNVREVSHYQRSIEEEGLATFRGCSLSPDDRRRKWIIQRLMCQFEIAFDEYEQNFQESFENTFGLESGELSDFASDGILEVGRGGIRVTSVGRLFVRNIAMVFDSYLRAPNRVIYSNTV